MADLFFLIPFFSPRIERPRPSPCSRPAGIFAGGDTFFLSVLPPFLFLSFSPDPIREGVPVGVDRDLLEAQGLAFFFYFGFLRSKRISRPLLFLLRRHRGPSRSAVAAAPFLFVLVLSPLYVAGGPFLSGGGDPFSGQAWC